jgi:hypothetical protein
MKKAVVLSLVLMLALAGIASAGIGVGAPVLLGPAVAGIVTVQPNFVLGIDSLDIVAGYSSLAQGTGSNAQTHFVVGGAYYLLKNGPVSAGPSLFYVSNGLNTGTQRAEDNTRTNTMIGFSAKAPLASGIDLRTDAILYNMVGGKQGGVEIKDMNQILPAVQLSVVINFI